MLWDDALMRCMKGRRHSVGNYCCQPRHNKPTEFMFVNKTMWVFTERQCAVAVMGEEGGGGFSS